MSKQATIPGTRDDVPAEVEDKAAEYVKALRARQQKQKKEDTLRAELIEMMHEHDVTVIEHPDDSDKILELVGGSEKIKTKKREDAGED